MNDRAYMASGDNPHDGACLVFAPNAREARRLAWPVVREWMDLNWIEVRVKWIRGGADHLREQDGPHVVEAPKACVTCEWWHAEPYDENGRCEACAEWHGEEAT